MSVPMRFVPERVEPVQGVPLLGDDLRDLLALADHQRRRHVRALHDTWGIAAGLYLDEDESGRPTVHPGVAYDRCGRLLVLPAMVALPDAQRLAEPHVVVLRADLERGEPAAELRFAAAGEQLRPGLDLVLGVVRASEGELAWSDRGRRYVRSAAPVAVAAGVVRHGSAIATGTAQQWSADIDVTAGLDRVPVYVAAVAAGRPPAGARTATVQLSSPRVDGFTITVRRPVTAMYATSLDSAKVKTNPLDITWIAVLAQEPGDVD